MNGIFVNLFEENQNTDSAGESCYGDCNCYGCHGCYQCYQCYQCYCDSKCYEECGSNSYC